MEVVAFERRRIPEGAILSTWRAADGWAYRRMDWRQPRQAGARGNLLFAGGRGDFIEKYLEACGHWHARGWNVTMFDWRGQGGSQEIVETQLGSLDPLVDDLTALVADWRSESAGPHVVVAHSMGGHILLRTLVEGEAQLDAAVLVAPMVMINARPLPRFAASHIASFITGLGLGGRPAWKTPRRLMQTGSRRQAFLTSSPERYEDEAWWWREHPGYHLGAPSWGWLRAAYRSSARLTPASLSTIRIPLLFIAASHDRLVSSAAIRRAAAAVPGAELLIFERAGHEILRESDPVRLEALARIDSFLDQRAPA
ncbi:MAG: alpha/beta hydrolase [Alphaproteobacteria bacterium]|nr:alpha/beta hydrolase [Alphaproteobacteria bacterium]